jgi:hypothetical protein
MKFKTFTQTLEGLGQKACLWCGTVLMFFLLFNLNLGFGQGLPGSIEGKVVDSKGQPIVGVNVVAVETATNQRRGAVSDENGNYKILSVPQGNYNVAASFIGFQSVENQNLRMGIGQTLRLDFTLKDSTVDLGEIMIVAETPAIEMRQTQVATPITSQQLRELPVFNRNFLAFGQLVPGARSFDGGAADFNSGFSRPGVQSATGAVFGQYIIDGLNTKGRTAGSSISGNEQDVWLSQLAIQEMQFINHGYDAQYDGGTAVTVVETRRGTNNLEVDLLFNGYTDWMRAQGPLEQTRPKDFYRYQSGFFVGGPIVKDKLFFATTYERSDEVNPIAFVIPNDPLFASYERQINNREGYTLWSTKFTAQLNNANTVDLSWFARRDPYDVVLPGANMRDWGWTKDQKSDIVSLRHRYTPGTGVTNELVATFRYNQWVTNSLSERPLNLFLNYGFLDGPLNLVWPLEQKESIFTVVNNYQVIKGRHVLKAGGSYEYNDVSYLWPLLSQPFIIYAAPGVPLLGQIGLGRTDQTGTSDAFTQIPAHLLTAFIQDDWDLNDRLLLSFGLRYTSNINHLNNGFTLDNFNAGRLRAAGVPEAYIPQGNRKNYHNLAPRFRFSYDLTGNSRTVINGGYAMSFDRPPLNDINDEARGFNWLQATIPFEALGGFPFSADPAVLRQYATALGINNVAPNVTLLNEDVRNNRFDDYSLGLNQRINNEISGSVNFVMKNMSNGFASWNFNPLTESGARRATQQYGDIFLANDSWSSHYRAMLMTVRRAFKDGWMFQANYTLARVTSDFQRPIDPGLFENVNAQTDERHRFLVSWIYTLPLDIKLSGIVTVASPTPINAITGTDDNFDGDPDNDFLGGIPFNYRPDGFSNWYRNFDLAFTKGFEVNGKNRIEVRADIFNALNVDNWSAFQNNFAAPTFGEPITAFSPRRLQLGVRYTLK